MEKPTKDQIATLRSQGLTFTEIAACFDIPYQAVWYRWHYVPKERKPAITTLTGRDYVRELVRMRDDFTCQSCGKVWVEGTRRFDIHHLNGLCGKKSHGLDRKEDMPGLITYCHQCHLGTHVHGSRMGSKLSPDQRSSLLNMLDQGVKHADIATHFGISLPGVRHYVYSRVINRG